ncbi:hypothetical protein [Polaromonas sp. YR568]|uniref:hypothetical protein n=1 Tax=Polaromonas sp. YR568 TaxID=1855301 RepID=UPI00398BC210
MRIDFSKSADQIVKDLTRNETIFILAGMAIAFGAEMLHAGCMPKVSIWTVRGLFFPVVSVVSILAMVSSVGMQNSLKERGAPHPVEHRRQCVQFLIDAGDAEGMRLLKGIGIAANLYCLAFGIIAGVCVASFLNP